MKKSKSANSSELVLDYKNGDAIICLWMKSVFLFPIWAMFVVGLLGSVAGVVTGLMFPAYLLALAFGLAYYFHDYQKLKLVLKENILKVGFWRIELSNLRSIYVKESGMGSKSNVARLHLEFDDGEDVLKLNRFTTQDLEAFLNYLKSHVPTCEINRTVKSFLEDRKENDYTINVRIYESAVIVQMYDAWKNLKVWWSEKALLGILALCFPIWSHFTLLLLVISPPNQDKWQQTQEGLFEPFTIFSRWISTWFGFAFSGTLALAGQGVVQLQQNPFVLTGCFIFVIGLMICFLRDIFSWNECKVTSENIILNRCTTGKVLNVEKIRWDELTGLELKNDTLAVQKGSQTYAMNLKNISPLDREKIFQTIYKFAPREILSLEDQESFQPHQKFSYTELWLQSLTGSPQQESLLPLQKGSVLKDDLYKVNSALGSGGQGTAYLCSMGGEENKVVLKETIFPLFVDKSLKRTAIDRFEQEVNLLKNLQHNGIVNLLDAFIEDHRGYIVLEHIDGKNLRELRKIDSLDEEKLKNLILQMCDVLCYLHNKGYTHRDFTPENLVLDGDDKVTLIDFAVANKISDGVTATVVGKHSYIAPEQFRGRACSQSDLYSLGATIFFLITGKDPEPISKLYLSESDPYFGTVYDTIIQNCTSLDLESRWPSASRVRNELCEETVTINISENEKEGVWQS